MESGVNKNQVFDLIMMTGKILLENGAEIFRVEETMQIIAHSYHVTEIDTFVIANGIFMTMTIDGYGTRTSQIKHVPISPVHLGRVTSVNNLSRNIVAGHYTIDEAMTELQKISVLPYESNLLRVLFAGVGSGSFCYILGGSIFDSIVSFIAGFLLYILLIPMEKAKIPGILNHVFGGAFVTILSLFLYSLGLGTNLDKIIIGSIICLVPGVSFTTSVRDFFNGDYLSGTIHLVYALLVAAGISVGVGIAITTWHALF